MNFGIGLACSKVPGSPFSQGLIPGPGLLYKICLNYEVNTYVVSSFFDVWSLAGSSVLSLFWHSLNLQG